MKGKDKCIQDFQKVETGKVLFEDLISVVRKIWKCKFKVEWKGENWIYLAENRAVVNTITNFRIAKNVGNFWIR
jgi:hypothetical protein